MLVTKGATLALQRRQKFQANAELCLGAQVPLTVCSHNKCVGAEFLSHECRVCSTFGASSAFEAVKRAGLLVR